MEQWQLVGLITRRSLVQIQPPLPISEVEEALVLVMAQGLLCTLPTHFCGLHRNGLRVAGGFLQSADEAGQVVDGE